MWYIGHGSGNENATVVISKVMALIFTMSFYLETAGNMWVDMATLVLNNSIMEASVIEQFESDHAQQPKKVHSGKLT